MPRGIFPARSRASAIGAFVNLSGGASKGARTFKVADEKVRPYDQARFEKPWQDRQTLLQHAVRAAVSRRLAHGFRFMPKTMKEN
jgi:hypothetical protein